VTGIAVRGAWPILNEPAKPPRGDRIGEVFAVAIEDINFELRWLP
jgi:hypothetical protein